MIYFINAFGRINLTDLFKGEVKFIGFEIVWDPLFEKSNGFSNKFVSRVFWHFWKARVKHDIQWTTRERVGFPIKLESYRTFLWDITRRVSNVSCWMMIHMIDESRTKN